MKNLLRGCSISLGLSLAAMTAHAAPVFVNALLIPGDTLDASGGTLVNDGRLGFFSDIYYDPQRNEWWALSDRGPGGGTLFYDTRVHRFTIDIDPATGAISDFQVLQTLIFREGSHALNGLAPAEGFPLDTAFDPEGVVVSPVNGHLFISDEYGPSVVEVNGAGQVVHRYDIPVNLVPRNAATGAPNHASDTGNDAGKRTNRGMEGLAISPDGRTLYAMLQSAMLDEGAGSGVYNRIVAFDTRHQKPIAQYAYKMEASSQGRGISALVALNDHQFLVLERNNRGVGVDAELTPPNKKVFRIDLDGATDVTQIDLDGGALFAPVQKVATPWLDLAAAATLASADLAPFNKVSPEKWEGLAIGPKLADGSYLVLAGTDNDYSISQDAGTAVQYEVRFRPLGPSSVERIRCTIGTLDDCVFVNANGSLGSAVPAGYNFTGYRLIPGVLHAYKASATDLAGLVRPGSKKK